MTNEKAVAEKLLQINAIKLSPKEPFTWASGWKSPIYCDNRKVLSFPYIRDFVKSELCSVASGLTRKRAIRTSKRGIHGSDQGPAREIRTGESRDIAP